MGRVDRASGNAALAQRRDLASQCIRDGGGGLEFSASIAANGNDANAYRQRGWAYFEKGDNDKALADANSAIALKPDLTNAYMLRGIRGGAGRQLQSYGSLYMRGIVKTRSGQPAEDQADMDAAKALRPNVTDEYAACGVRP
jgi:tetratricopeptide (TPR) repeat protein